MGFRSTFVTSDNYIPWPQWFREKYKAWINFPVADGPLSSISEGKTYGVFSDLHADIQRSLSEVVAKGGLESVIIIYLHECGGITKCVIHPDEIKWSEPTGWEQTDGVTHNYCYGCSDA